MTRKIQTGFRQIAVSLALTSLTACVALAEIQSDKALSAIGNNACAGNFNATAKMTNSTGGSWLTPPAGKTNGTFADASGFAVPYKSVVLVTRKSDLATWCATNSVTFPASSSASYSLAVYVTSTLPPPTNGQPMALQVTLH